MSICFGCKKEFEQSLPYHCLDCSEQFCKECVGSHRTVVDGFRCHICPSCGKNNILISMPAFRLGGPRFDKKLREKEEILIAVKKQKKSRLRESLRPTRRRVVKRTNRRNDTKDKE